MKKLNITEEDQTKVITFLNMVASHATFSMNTKQLIEYFRLLNYMQTILLPKIEANIFEIKEVINTKPEDKKENEDI